MNQPRRQVSQLQAGDRFSVQLTLHFNIAEVAEPNGNPDVVHLRVRPVPCSDECSSSCKCNYTLFPKGDATYPLCLEARQRLPFFGNLEQLLAQSKLISAQIARLQPEAKSNGDSSSELAEVEVVNDGTA